MNRTTIPPERHGERLDQALALLLPGAGLRERRRLVEDGAVLLDGRPRPKGFKVAAGQTLELRAPAPPPGAGALGVRLLEVRAGYAALFKPGGVHSAALAGRGTPSVEAVLEELLPGRGAVLLNRLDRLTSGIVLAAVEPGAADRYYGQEDAGRVIKEYAALAEGCLEWPVTVKNALDTADTKKTKVLPREDDSHLRWTRVEPLDWDEAENRTRLRVTIHKGARHQIRAHLAHIGHPVAGDPLYGTGEGERLFLHHGRVEFEGFLAEVGDDFA